MSRYNLVVVGGGTAGLVSAAGAAGLGAKVALVERRHMGGDCLNHGCVPSKALINAARMVVQARAAGEFGVGTGPVDLDFAAAMSRVRRVRAELAVHDSVERLTSLGVDVFLGQARFVAHDAVDVDGQRLRFTRGVIATGARPEIPPIPGLADAGFLTYESIPSLTSLPARLVILGAGSIACEMAQTFRRFGAAVTLVTTESRLLPREDPDASAALRDRFLREGIDVRTDAVVERVERDGEGMMMTCAGTAGPASLWADAVLVVTGRVAALDGLDLERAGIRANGRGLVVDRRLRTTNPRVFAAGDCTSLFQSTHAADAMARIVVENALFHGRRTTDGLIVPRVTYTDPEIAHVGLSAQDAARRHDVRTLTLPLASVDRAVIDGASEGFARVHLGRRGRILGATVAGAHAGELIGEIGLAITARLSIAAVGRTIHAYPGFNEAWRKLADAWRREKLTPAVASVLASFLRWRR